MLFAFTLLWVYTFYAQYLTIWYGNLPSERNRMVGMQDGDYTFIFWAMFALKFVIPFSTLALTFTRHNVKATAAVATCIIIGTLFERYVWIGGVNGGKGTYPILTAIVVSSVVAIAGFLLVRMRLQSTQLVKG
jgi:lipopolysaccharide export LptBFGC system permease protein LptF